MKKTMNIYDIAERSGVSIATVSRVINKSGYVSEETKLKVMNVIDETRFSPNVFARGLNFNSIGLVGIVCADLSDVFYSAAVSYLEKFLRDYNLNTLLVCAGYKKNQQEYSLYELVNKNVDAIILVGTIFNENNKDTIVEIAKKTPIFMVNSYINALNIFSVRCDEKKISKDTMNLLIKNGYTSPMYFYRPSFSGNNKIAGIKESLTEHKILENGIFVITKFDDSNTTVSFFENTIKQYADTADCVLTGNDQMAAYAIKALKNLSIKLPVIGFNNSPIADMLSPGLTTIDNMLEEMCAITVNNLNKYLQGEMPEVLTVLDGKLIRRDTF